MKHKYIRIENVGINRLHQGGYKADELEQDNPYNGGSNEG